MFHIYDLIYDSAKFNFTFLHTPYQQKEMRLNLYNVEHINIEGEFLLKYKFRNFIFIEYTEEFSLINHFLTRA